MKINKVDIRFYSVPRRVPITNGKYTYKTANALVIQIFTDEGPSGIGWANANEIGVATAKQMEPLLIGEDPLNVDRIWEKLYLPKIFGRKGPTIKAQSAIDVALWDLRGKVFNVPLYKLLGGFRNEVPVYIAGGYYQVGKSNADLVKEMEANLAKGVKVMKMKIGAVPIPEDLKRIEEVLKVVDGKAQVMVDANNAYSRIDALKMGYELDKIGSSIYWFEEPISCDDIEGHTILSAKLRTPIAIGENSYTRYEFKDLLEARAASILNADALVLGGITEWKKVADLAAAYNIPIAPHGSQEIHVSLVASIPNGLIVEYYDSNTNELRDRIFRNRLKLNPNGTVSPFEGPGLGLEFDFDAMEQYRVC